MGATVCCNDCDADCGKAAAGKDAGGVAAGGAGEG